MYLAPARKEVLDEMQGRISDKFVLASLPPDINDERTELTTAVSFLASLETRPGSKPVRLNPNLRVILQRVMPYRSAAVEKACKAMFLTQPPVKTIKAWLEVQSVGLEPREEIYRVPAQNYRASELRRRFVGSGVSARTKERWRNRIYDRVRRILDGRWVVSWRRPDGSSRDELKFRMWRTSEFDDASGVKLEPILSDWACLGIAVNGLEATWSGEIKLKNPAQ